MKLVIIKVQITHMDGVANIHKAIEKMKENHSVDNTHIQEITYDGTTQSIELNNIAPNIPLVATMVWTDPVYEDYESLGDIDDSTKTLVNDINITITDESGTIYYPWMLDGTNPANAATNSSLNDTDNVEQIQIDSPSGKYTLTIDHVGSITNTDQNISLILSCKTPLYQSCNNCL